PSVTWHVVSDQTVGAGTFQVRQKVLRGVVDNSAYPNVTVEIRALLETPIDADGPVPVVLEIGGRRRQMDAWKSLLLSKRWGYALLDPWSVQPDDGSLDQGIIGLTAKGQQRNPDDWGVIRAWAWGASRVVDYLETDSLVDAKRVWVEGLSRLGKTALVAMAMDQRFSMALVGSSGAGGAKILRRRFGEQIENIVVPRNFSWFCG